MIFRKSKKKENKIDFIEPDEIFLDSSNLPHFDSNKMEGRLEKTISKKTGYIFIFFVIFLPLLILGRTWNLSLDKENKFAKWGENNRLNQTTIFADRGAIYDRNDKILAWNEETPDSNLNFKKRVYLDLEGLGHILGFVKYPQKDSNGFYYNSKVIGLSGVEKSFNDYLSGKNGAKIIETDVLGNISSESVFDKPKDGSPVKLSIDAEVNNKFYSILRQTANERGFSGGSAVLMKVDTGEILALTNYPEYKSQIMSDGQDETQIDKYAKDENNPYLNRAVNGLYTPGSIIKLFVALGVLNEKIINPQKQIMSTGSISIPNEYDPEKVSIFYDWKAHGLVDMRHAIAVSSNVYFYEVGGGFEDQEGLGILNMERYLRIFGFGEGAEDKFLAGEIGTLPNPDWKEKYFPGDPWRVGDTYNTAIGQYGLQITPIQAVRAVSAIATKGKLVEPSILFQDGQTPIKKRDTGISPNDYQVIKEGMRLSVTEGTAKGLDIPNMKIGAKTGTAQIGIKKDYVNSWVIGFFPYEEPKYTFAVLMERGPEKNTIGALYVMRQFIEWLIINKPNLL